MLTSIGLMEVDQKGTTVVGAWDGILRTAFFHLGKTPRTYDILRGTALRPVVIT